VHAVARGRALAFATERVFGIGFHYDVVAGAAAAAKFASARRIATQLVLHEADWIELLVGLAIGHDKLTEAV